MMRRLKAAGEGWVEDQAAQMGAALAYYTLFSLTPLLIIAIAIIGSIHGEVQTREQVVSQVREFLGNDSALAVEDLIDNFHIRKTSAGHSLTTSIVGVLSLWFGATGMFTSLRSSLGRIWRLPPVRENLFVGLIKTYLLAVVMVFVTCVFLIALLLVSTALPLLAQRWGEQFPALPWSGPIVYFGLSTFLLMLLFAFTFRFLSDGRIPYRHLWSGAFVSAVLFTVGKMVIGLYLSYANLASAYGAAGSLVVFLAWVYYSAQILFFGAEVIRCGLGKAAAPGTSPR
jgi:membrane protein